jgi:hypothetical protein
LPNAAGFAADRGGVNPFEPYMNAMLSGGHCLCVVPDRIRRGLLHPDFFTLTSSP